LDARIVFFFFCFVPPYFAQSSFLDTGCHGVLFSPNRGLTISRHPPGDRQCKFQGLR
jgi:hypothetical protein